MLKLVGTKIQDDQKFIDMGSGAPEMTTMTGHSKQTYFILAEGPRRSDAGFTSQWLLSAIEADRLLQNYFSENPDFHVSIVRLECPYRIEFAQSALFFIGMWQAGKGSFSLDLLDPEWAEIFCIMARLGFFKQTGQRYQMIVPEIVAIDRIKDELLRLIATQDSKYRLHPEELLTNMPQQQAMDWKRKLKRMNWQKRVADRHALLAE
jgi:hypothetical protein